MSKQRKKNRTSNKKPSAVPIGHAEMLAQVLEVFSFLDYADLWEGPNGEGFEDMCELPDLRGRSIYDLIRLANDVTDLLRRVVPVIARNGSRDEIKAAMRKWGKATEGRFDGDHYQVVSSMADWVIRIRAMMEEVGAAA